MFKSIISVYIILLLYIVGDAMIINLVRHKSPTEVLHENKHLFHPNLIDEVWKPPKPKPNTTNHTISLLRHLDSEFYGQITVGSTNRTFNVIFDTSWHTAWLMSVDCPSSKLGCYYHNKYDHSRSNTYKPDGTKFNANEGSYNLSGYYSYENFNYAGMRVKGTHFVEMNNVPLLYLFSKADGIIPLSLPYGNDTSFVNELYLQKKLKNPLFTVYLNRDKHSQHGGAITLGEISKKHIHVTNKQYDNVTYVKILGNSPYWEFKMDGVFGVLMKNIRKTICEGNCTALVDTGTSRIVASKAEVDIINGIIGAKPFHFGRFEVNCAGLVQMPSINFVIDGKNFTLKAKEYVQTITVASYTVCLSNFEYSSAPTEEGKWIIGGAFLAKYYSIYKLDTKEVGFVTAA